MSDSDPPHPAPDPLSQDGPPPQDRPPSGPPVPDGATPECRERFNRLFLQIEEELRRIAHEILKGNRRVEDIHTTVLVHDMYLRLSAAPVDTWSSPQELELAAAVILRNLLTDAARRRDCRKRGGGANAEDLEILLEHFERGGREELSKTDLLDLNAALEAFAKQAPEAARMVELHYYLGVDDKEIGRVFGVAARTVRRKLGEAKIFLKQFIENLPGGPDDPDGAGCPVS